MRWTTPYRYPIGIKTRGLNSSSNAPSEGFERTHRSSTSVEARDRRFHDRTGRPGLFTWVWIHRSKSLQRPEVGPTTNIAWRTLLVTFANLTDVSTSLSAGRHSSTCGSWMPCSSTLGPTSVREGGSLLFCRGGSPHSRSPGG